jgi:hypothetical protein
MYIGEEVRYLSLLYNAKSGIPPHSVTAPVDASSFSASASASVSPSVVPCPILQSTAAVCCRRFASKGRSISDTVVMYQPRL